MYQIAIEDLNVACKIGVSEQERSANQQLKISARLELQTEAIPASDRIEETLSYSEVKKLILSIAGQSEVCLLESLATELLRALLEIKEVRHAQIKIEKPEIWKNGVPSVSLSRRKILKAPALPQGF